MYCKPGNVCGLKSSRFFSFEEFRAGKVRIFWPLKSQKSTAILSSLWPPPSRLQLASHCRKTSSLLWSVLERCLTDTMMMKGGAAWCSQLKKTIIANCHRFTMYIQLRATNRGRSKDSWFSQTQEIELDTDMHIPSTPFTMWTIQTDAVMEFSNQKSVTFMSW